MPFGEVRLIPGVNVERTPTLLEAGVAQSQYIRYKDGLVQKYGGFAKFFSLSVSGTPRDLHAWEDLNQTAHLAMGSTSQLAVITSGVLTDITPQTVTSDIAPNFTTASGSALVEIVDANISNVTVFDSVLFNTPVAVGGLILSGLYAITVVTGTHSYKITAASAATSIATNGGAVPVFTTASGTSSVNVLLVAHGLAVGETVVFPIATTGNGVTIEGSYTAATIVDADNFSIVVSAQATANGSFSMNGGNAEFVYYINLGPAALGAGYGLGGYGTGGYGTGTTPTSQTGSPIAATDWSNDNWGQILLSCPRGGGVYQYDPSGGFSNSGLVSTAPAFNGGLFVSVSQQILVCWASTVTQDIGIQQDPMLVRWSASGDYTDFVPLTTNQAGSFRIPIGSTIRGGDAVANQDLIWTDLDLWAMNYQGLPFVFGFNKIGAGAGLISAHAKQQLRGSVYWMGQSNFYSYNSNGVAVIPCPVWDFVFQNLNTGVNAVTGLPYTNNIRTLPNTPFNEAGWAFPSTASATGENDSYVKFNITEPGAPWDYGAIARSAWIDQTVLGPPIGSSPGGIIYQHETTNDADGAPLVASFTTGYFYIAEGEEFAFVDQILPDFKYGEYGAAQGAQIQMSFNLINYTGDTPTTYGPFTVTQTTRYLTTRMRGRQMSFTISSSDIGSFWRLGKIRYRYRPDGRR
jgi:hypothetical protein